MATQRHVKVRSVFKNNLDYEFSLIHSSLHQYCNIALDCEFPGTIMYHPTKQYRELNPTENFLLMVENVNCLKLIQMGLTLCDSDGNLPDFGSNCCYVWEFNFKEFDPDEDAQNPDSIKLLEKQGIDFVKNQIDGIDAKRFAKLFLASGLGFSLRSFLGCRNVSDPMNLTWVFFHCTYDVGFLIKVLTQKELPENLVSFMALVQLYLGPSVLDVKEMVKPFGWQVGLEKVAEYLKVDRIAGKSHQAGSDSLLTMQSFLALRMNYIREGYRASMYQMFNYKLHGLEVNQSLVQQELVLLRKNLVRSSRRNHHPVVYGNHAVMFHPIMNYHRPALAVQPVFVPTLMGV